MLFESWPTLDGISKCVDQLGWHSGPYASQVCRKHQFTSATPTTGIQLQRQFEFASCKTQPLEPNSQAPKVKGNCCTSTRQIVSAVCHSGLNDMLLVLALECAHLGTKNLALQRRQLYKVVESLYSFFRNMLCARLRFPKKCYKLVP